MTTAILESIERLSRDLKESAITLSKDETRFLVDAYYMMQDQRLRAENQVRSLSKTGEPHVVLDWLSIQSRVLENQVKRALDQYSQSHLVGRWSRSHVGIGPVISAGLIAHIDIEKAPTAGHIWNYAGLNPGIKWEKGQRRPWNAELKTLCWKIGTSFIKMKGKEGSVYREIYEQHFKTVEKNNKANKFKTQAAEILKTKKISKITNAYKAYSKGKLPDAHVIARGRRAAVKLFLSHWHHIAFEDHYGKPPPMPYAIAHLAHAHYLEPQWGPMSEDEFA
ncbi:MAG: hypothetical protein ACR2RB_02275 [Gammaproteobacteria bacterium]